MRTILLFRISLRSLTQHKARSLLTILGIVIGISAIIASLAIGRGAEEKTRQRFLALGNNYIALYAGNWLQEGKTTSKKRKYQPLSQHDVKALKKLCPKIRYLSPFSSRRSIISYRQNTIQSEVKGGNEQTLKIIDRKIKRGIFFNQHHAKQGSRVIILGSKAAAELFSSLDPVQQTIRVKNTPFTVIGVLKKMENYQGIRDPNFDVFMPRKSLQKYVDKYVHHSVHTIIASASTKDDMPGLVHNMRKVMRFRRKVKDEEPDNFTIIDQASMMKHAQSAAATIRLLLLIIASISLLVGGIGIMNIMLVSVTERTREIGIRMALGATGRTILFQFLIEAVTLCCIGGAIGTLFGILIPYAIAHMTDWKPIVTISSIVVAVITTSAIGIFFGFYPARKASRLNPVDALMER